MPIIIKIDHSDRDILMALAEGFNLMELRLINMEANLTAASDRLTADVAALLPALGTLISTSNAAIAALRASAPAADDSAAENAAADALEKALGDVQAATAADSIASVQSGGAGGAAGTDASSTAGSTGSTDGTVAA